MNRRSATRTVTQYFIFLYDQGNPDKFKIAPMRGLSGRVAICKLMEELGKQIEVPLQVYFTGGATAVLCGWRETTVDVDLRLEPDYGKAYTVISELKESLNINVELASPEDFIPVPENWKDRSLFIDRHGKVSFYHFDLCSQALAKIERGWEQDEEDCRNIVKNFVSLKELAAGFAVIKPKLDRYPGTDPVRFEEKVFAFVRTMEEK